MIFTYVWAFDQQVDWDYIAWLTRVFEAKGAMVGSQAHEGRDKKIALDFA